MTIDLGILVMFQIESQSSSNKTRMTIKETVNIKTWSGIYSLESNQRLFNFSIETLTRKDKRSCFDSFFENKCEIQSTFNSEPRFSEYLDIVNRFLGTGRYL